MTDTVVIKYLIISAYSEGFDSRQNDMDFICEYL